MITTKWFNKFFYAVTIVALMIKLIAPTTVYADDGVPPTEPAPVSEPADPAVPDAVESPVVDPAGTDAALPDESGQPMPLEPEVLQDLPVGMEVVVLDESGQPLPLGSQAAAEAIAIEDPMWCEEGYTPGTFDSAHCTTAQASIADLLIDLGTLYTGSDPIGKGTIYFTPTYSGSDFSIANDSNANAGSAYNTLWDRITDLTIQGGWNGLTGGSSVVTGVTTFTRPIKIIWTDNLTLNDITYDGTNDSSNPDSGLILVESGAGKTLTLDHVEVLGTHNTNNLASGANIAGTAAGSVVITDSAFSQNQQNGLTLYEFGNVTLTRVDASNNATNIGGYGAKIECYSGSGCANGTVTLTDSTFNGNGSVANSTQGYGLDVRTNGTISISGVTANGNTADGAKIQNTEGTKDLTISNSTFGSTATLGSFGASPTAAQRLLAGNGGVGLTAYSKGALTLNSVIADYNYFHGLESYEDGTGTLTIDKSSPSSPASSFSHNGMDGIFASTGGGAVTLNSVLATDNGQHGAELGSSSDTGNYSITGGTCSNSGRQTYHPTEYAYDGLNVNTSGNIAVSGVTASGNARNGASLSTTYGSNTGTVTVTNSTFGEAMSIFSNGTTYDADHRKWGNGGRGLEIMSGGASSLNTVTANYNGSAWLAKNGGDGIALTTDAAISLNTVNANYNYKSGLNFSGAGPSVTLNTVTAHDNGLTSSPLFPGINGSDLTASLLSVSCTSNSITNNGAADTITCTGSGSSGGGSSDGGGSSNGEGSPDAGFVTGAGPVIEIISMQTGQNVDLSCSAGVSGFDLQLSDSEVSLSCGGFGGSQTNSVTMTTKTSAELPAPVDAKYSFIAGMDVTVSTPFSDKITVSFKLPADMPTGNFSILFWDGSQWIDLGGSITADGFFTTQSDKAGMFVLVTK